MSDPPPAPPPLPVDEGGVTALRKHPCPECGGDAEWHPGKQALACPYCGTVLPWSPGEDVQGERLRELDLVRALAEVDATGRDWKEAKREVKCQSCHAITVFDADRAAQRCDFCGSPQIVPHEESQAPITPGGVLPFKLSKAQVTDKLRAWYTSRWFAPNRFKKAALTDTLHGIYLPYWTFDAHVEADWSAMAGYYYYVTVRRRGSDGKMQSVQERRTRWEPASGEIAHFFDDDLVPGTRGVPLDLLHKIEPFPTRGEELKPYDPAYVRGWTVERYQVDLRQATATSRERMDARVREMCGREVPGDTYRDLRVQARYSGRTFKHVLVPVWLVTYTYGPKTFRVLVNGVTGKLEGKYPLSWWKIFFFVILPITILLVVLFFMMGKG